MKINDNKIIKYPALILRKKCQKIKEIDDEIKKLGLEMTEIMITNQGIGLAAPQIGELKRIIVIKTERGAQVFINPEIIKKSKEMEIMEEGCLSFPGLFLKIKRAKEIEVNAFNLKGKEFQLKAEGLLARVIQHEIDHLDGILFVDQAGFWQKLKLKLWL